MWGPRGRVTAYSVATNLGPWESRSSTIRQNLTAPWSGSSRSWKAVAATHLLVASMADDSVRTASL